MFCFVPNVILFFFLSTLFREDDGQWKEEQKLEAHSDWVRDVAWAPSIGLPTSTIASCSQARLRSLDIKCILKRVGEGITNIFMKTFGQYIPGHGNHLS